MIFPWVFSRGFLSIYPYTRYFAQLLSHILYNAQELQAFSLQYRLSVSTAAFASLSVFAASLTSKSWKEQHTEIHTALDRIDFRERIYLWYRFGFEDDMEHPLTETAKHFHLSESLARSTEKTALDHVRLELP